MSLLDFPVTLTTTIQHPEYQYWYDNWATIRDCMLGETAIKRKGSRYLPKTDGMEVDDYEAYLDRAVFFNMTQRTVTGLSGTLFRRPPVVEGLPSKLDTSSISKRNQPVDQFAKEVAREVLQMGRYGVLLDMDQQGKRSPYFSGYIAENIIDWTVHEIDGRWMVTEVVLRELRLDRPHLNSNAYQATPKAQRKALKQLGSPVTSQQRATRRWVASYRVLRLEPDPDAPGELIYRQYYHTSENGDASPDIGNAIVFTPTMRGRPFRFMPFVFFGPHDNTPDIDKSPIQDIVSLNVSHYRSYAQLEHGRFYTAMPVYYAPVEPGQEQASYTLGPNVVWEVSSEKTRPGIIEFNGSGLKYLTEACDKKEDQIAALGGRLVGVERVSAGQSDNNLKMKEANEQALLLNVSNVLDSGLTSLLRWWAIWLDTPEAVAAKITFKVNKDFLLNASGAREFRAIQMMYEAGILPIQAVYDYLKRTEVIPDWMALEEFEGLLSDPTAFPNNVDVQARMRGAPDARTEWESEHVLVDPAVVAVRGYDSQAPEGQKPLPGQTQGPAVTAEQTAPPKNTPAPVKPAPKPPKK